MYVSTVDPACCRTGHLILVYLHPQAPESSVYCNRWKNGPPIIECKTNTEAVTKDWEENRNAVDEARKRLNLELANCLARVHVHYGFDYFFCPECSGNLLLLSWVNCLTGISKETVNLVVFGSSWRRRPSHFVSAGVAASIAPHNPRSFRSLLFEPL